MNELLLSMCATGVAIGASVIVLVVCYLRDQSLLTKIQTVDKRCNFLENQNKERKQEIAWIDEEIKGDD